MSECPGLLVSPRKFDDEQTLLREHCEGCAERDTSLAKVKELERDRNDALFMVHEMNRQLGAVDDAIARVNLDAATALVRHLIERSGRLLDNLKSEVAKARRGAR